MISGHEQLLASNLWAFFVRQTERGALLQPENLNDSSGAILRAPVKLHLGTPVSDPARIEERLATRRIGDRRSIGLARSEAVSSHMQIHHSLNRLILQRKRISG